MLLLSILPLSIPKITFANRVFLILPQHHLPALQLPILQQVDPVAPLQPNDEWQRDIGVRECFAIVTGIAAGVYLLVPEEIPNSYVYVVTAALALSAIAAAVAIVKLWNAYH